ncbi:MAG: sulfatase [Bryobacterales bacterium]|nr:sulfatase [Bryobacterales bacterium]
MSAHSQNLARRTFLKGLYAVGGASATGWTGCDGSPGAKNQTNVLLILTEDQGAQMGALGTKGLRTPNMDAIATHGVILNNAFVAYPVCSPSKGALYTGLYPHTNGLRSLTRNYFVPASELTQAELSNPDYNHGRIHDSVPTLVERLHDAGYYTGITMKLHVSPNYKFPFDEWIRSSEPDHCGTRGNPAKDQAVEFIRNAQERRAPWFLLYNISQPHRPFRNSDEQPIAVDPDEGEIPPFLPDTPVVRQDWAEYLDSIQCADSRVGEALAAVDETGSSDDTLVIFLGDHGPAFQRGKMTLYDFGLRVPMAIRGPGIRKGSVSEDLVSEIDIMPTILDYLGLKRPEQEHGISLLPILRGEADAHGHDYVFGEIHHDYLFFPAGSVERGGKHSIRGGIGRVY